MLRIPLIEYAALTGLALAAARFWTRRESTFGGEQRVELPPTRQVIAVVTILLAGYLAADHILSNGLIDSYVLGRAIGIVQLAAQAGFFVLAVTLFSGWVALFPVAVIVNTAAMFATSRISDWDAFARDALEWAFVLLTLEYIAFMAAAWWSRGGKAEVELNPDPIESPAPA